MARNIIKQEKRDRMLEKLILCHLNDSLLQDKIITEKEHMQMQHAIDESCKL